MTAMPGMIEPKVVRNTPFKPHKDGGHHGTGVVHELRNTDDGNVEMRIHHAPKSGRSGAEGASLPWEGQMTTVPLKQEHAEHYAVGDKVNVHIKPENDSDASEGEGSTEPKGTRKGKGFKRSGPESEPGENAGEAADGEE